MKDRVAAAVAEALRRYRFVRSCSSSAVTVPVVALSTAAAILILAFVTRPFFGSIPAETYARFGWSGASVMEGEWWRLFSATLLTRDAYMTISMVFWLLLAVGFYERMSGSLRALVVSFGGSVLGYAGVTFFLWLSEPLGSSFLERTARGLDVGFSAGVAACFAALVVALDYRPADGALAAVAVGGLLFHHQVADWEHVISVVVAYAMLRRVGPRFSELRPVSHPEGGSAPADPHESDSEQ